MPAEPSRRTLLHALSGLPLGVLLWPLSGAAAADEPATLSLPARASRPDDPTLRPGQGTLQFIGTATVLIRWGGLTLLTDPNFLHRGEEAPLGYGLSTPRLTDPALRFEQLPPIDLVVLSHYHGDHFDPSVEAKLDKRTPIVTTGHAARQLRERGFTATRVLETWQSLVVNQGDTRLTLTAMPARHGPLPVALALPDTMGTLLSFEGPAASTFKLYISGDTLVVDELREIPQRYPGIDLALLHLGGTRIFGVLVTMDAQQGLELLQIVRPELAIPIHYDDYPVFKSPLADFERAVREAGLAERVRVLPRGGVHAFQTRPPR